MKGLFLLIGFVGAKLNDDPNFTTSLPGDPVTTSTTCPNVTVMASVAQGWLDGCLGLDKNLSLTTAEMCQADCYADMHCSTWQLVNNSGVPHCWSGSVFHGCLSRGNNDTLAKFEGDLLAGEFVQHGEVKVVSAAPDQVIGLKHFVEKTGTDDEKMGRCKDICYTDVTCGVWQYGSDGCWIEHLPGHAAKETKPNSTWSEGMLGGEYITHTCPPYVEPEGLPWPWIIAGVILGLLALAALAYFLTKKPKVKKTRAVKIEPKKEPTVVYLQPTIMIPQQSLIMAPPAPVVQYAAPEPVVTYTQPVTQYVQQPVTQTVMTQAMPVSAGSVSVQPLLG